MIANLVLLGAIPFWNAGDFKTLPDRDTAHLDKEIGDFCSIGMDRVNRQFKTLLKFIRNAVEDNFDLKSESKRANV